MKVSRRGTSNAERKCKMEHEKCATCKRSSKADGWVVCANCIHNNSRKDRYEPMTNADRIRNMTDEELSEKISRIAPHCVYCPVKCGIFCTEEECKAKWLSWLRSPAEESEK